MIKKEITLEQLFEKLESIGYKKLCKSQTKLVQKSRYIFFKDGVAIYLATTMGNFKGGIIIDRVCVDFVSSLTHAENTYMFKPDMSTGSHSGNYNLTLDFDNDIIRLYTLLDKIDLWIKSGIVIHDKLDCNTVNKYYKELYGTKMSADTAKQFGYVITDKLETDNHSQPQQLHESGLNNVELDEVYEELRTNWNTHGVNEYNLFDIKRILRRKDIRKDGTVYKVKDYRIQYCNSSKLFLLTREL